SDGQIVFSESSSGGAASFNLTGGSLDISGLSTGMTIGSLEGAGKVFLGNKFLTIGGNNLSTTFSGIIADGSADGTKPGPGLVQKEGTGTLTLTGISTYTGPTGVFGGTLVVDGSIKSSSSVFVADGAALAGTGTVPSTFIDDGGMLVAGHNTAPFGALTVEGGLVFTAAATYMVQVSPSEAGR